MTMNMDTRSDLKKLSYIQLLASIMGKAGDHVDTARSSGLPLLLLFGAFHGSFMFLPATFAWALQFGLLTDKDFIEWKSWSGTSDVWLFTFGTVGTIYATLLVSSTIFLVIRSATPFRKYVIQEHTESDTLSWELKAGLLVKLFTGTLKSFVLYHLLPDMFNIKLPSGSRFLLQFAVAWFSFETLFYWWHRMEHLPWFYARIHKYHHQVTNPTGLHVVQQTVWSDLFLFVFRFLTFKFIVPLTAGPVHVLVFWLWGVVMIYDGVQTHGGLYLPWLPQATRKLFGGALRHEYHHAHNKGVYGWNLTFWDAVMGTDKEYREFESHFFSKRAAKL